MVLLSVKLPGEVSIVLKMGELLVIICVELDLLMVESPLGNLFEVDLLRLPLEDLVEIELFELFEPCETLEEGEVVELPLDILCKLDPLKLLVDELAELELVETLAPCEVLREWVAVELPE